MKRGAGSQAKTKVLVMAESTEVDNPKKGQKPKVVSDGTLIMNFLYKHPSENRMKFTKLKVACKYASIERGCALC